MISAPPLWRGKGQEIEFKWPKLYYKLCYNQRSLEVPDWWIHWCAGRVVRPDTNGREHGSSILGPSHILPYMSLHLAGPHLYPLNKAIIVKTVLHCVLWVVLANYQTWRESQEVTAGIWRGAVFLVTMPLHV